MAYTKTPCPGCGTVDHHRPANAVCQSCRQKLDRVAEIEAENQQLRAQVAETLSAETAPYVIYLPDSGYGIAQGRLAKSDAYSTFAKATAAMFKTMTAPLARGRVERWPGTVPVRYEYGTRTLTENHAEHYGWAELTKDGAEAARAWWKAMAAMVQAHYGAGVEDGRDLLVQLATGEMTVSQVNDRVYELVNRQRR